MAILYLLWFLSFLKFCRSACQTEVHLGMEVQLGHILFIARALSKECLFFFFFERESLSFSLPYCEQFHFLIAPHPNHLLFLKIPGLFLINI